jgi:peptide/nickel transport system permease protein
VAKVNNWSSPNIEIQVSKSYAKQSRIGDIWHRLRKNKAAVIGMIILAIMCSLALSVDWIFDYETDIIGQNISQRLQHPNAQHIFGTDELGRDIFNRVLYGSRYSLSVGFVAVLISLAISVPLGAIAGYFGGKAENIIMRLTDVLSSIPAILLAIVIVSALGSNMVNLMIAVGLSAVTPFVRITRAAVLTVRNQDFVEASRAIGKSEFYIIFRHILPNCLSPIIVQTTLRVADAIIISSSMSFLGLGVPAPTPEWGALLSSGRNFIRGYGYITIFPGLAIMITVLAFNLVGDALRDALDPKLKR